MPRLRIVAATLAVAGATVLPLAAAAVPASAAARHHACSTRWGINSKHRGSATITVATRVQGVRAGRHGCFDRLVIDLSGGTRPPFSARYVKHIASAGSGRILHVRGHARILITVRGPAGAHFAPNAVNLADVSGFRTFRQVRGAGSFERVTSIGLGVRAKLAFRVFELGDAHAGWRIVIDVAH